MDKPSNNIKWIAFILVAAVLFGCIFVYFVGSPMWKSDQDAGQRQEAAKHFRKIGIAIHYYGEAKPSWGIELKFDSYNGYFVSNKFEPETAESFVVINNQERFDEIFGVAQVMDDKSRRMPENIFESNVVLAVIKRGKAVWDFNVGSAMEDIQGIVSFRYTTSSKKSDSATFASPLIVSIPKGDYNAIIFIENGMPVKTIGFKQAKSD